MSEPLEGEGLEWPCSRCGELRCDCSEADACPACGEFWAFCECMGIGCDCAVCVARKAR